MRVKGPEIFGYVHSIWCCRFSIAPIEHVFYSESCLELTTENELALYKAVKAVET